MKKTYVIWAMLVTLALSVFATTALIAQSTYPNATGKTATTNTAQDNQVMAKESNYVLATAYHEGMVAFAAALNGQTMNGGPVNVDFARAAVVEMRRGFDQMKKYNDLYVGTMSAEARSKSTVTMKELEAHRTELNTQLTALEQEVKLAKPDAKKLSTLSASVHSHLDSMSSVSQSGQSFGMTLKN